MDIKIDYDVEIKGKDRLNNDRDRLKMVTEETAFVWRKKGTKCDCGVCWECKKPKRNGWGRSDKEKKLMALIEPI